MESDHGHFLWVTSHKYDDNAKILHCEQSNESKIIRSTQNSVSFLYQLPQNTDLSAAAGIVDI